MNISDNILKHYLRNVYFLAGTACGGKTTMAKAVAEKHGFVLVDEFRFSKEHGEIADEVHQPNMTIKFPDPESFFMRPAAEYSKQIAGALAEELEMSLMDLIILSQDKYTSGLFYIKRDENSTVENTLALLEKHFGLGDMDL